MAEPEPQLDAGAFDWSAEPAPELDEPPVRAPEVEASPPPLLRIIEALLFIGGPPLTTQRAAESIRGLSDAQFAETIETLNRDYRLQGRPYTIVPAEHGFALTLKLRYRSVQERLFGTVREARLSPAAIDVLALVAYRQPVARAEIESLRGGDSVGVLRQLVRHGLIAVSRRGEPGQTEVVYGTTNRFLDLFQLTGLDDLPQTQDLQKL